MRFLFCQTSEHSAATRYEVKHGTPLSQDGCAHAVKVIPHESLPYDEEKQPTYSDSVARGIGYRTPTICTIRYGVLDMSSRQRITDGNADHGTEKQESLSGTAVDLEQSAIIQSLLMPLSGLTDKEIEDKVTGLVKPAA